MYEEEMLLFDAYGKPFTHFERGVIYTTLSRERYWVLLRPGEKQEILPVLTKSVRIFNSEDE